MELFKCHNCTRVLYSIKEGDLDVEAICPKCRRINYPNRKDQGFGLRGKDFQMKSIDHICYICKKLLIRSIGVGKVQVQCYSCSKLGFKELVLFDTDLMRKGLFVPPELTDPKMIEYKKSIAR